MKKEKILEKEEWENIIDNSKTGFEKTTDKGFIQLVEWNNIEKAKMEMNRRLKDEIRRFNIASAKYSNKMMWLLLF